MAGYNITVIMARRFVILIVLALAIALYPLPVDAAVKGKGLFVSPTRQELKVAAGNTATGDITIANYSNKPMTIKLYVQQFSVTEYAYDFKFTPPTDDWVKLSETLVELQPNQSRQIRYVIAAPPGAQLGGHYFTIFASADLLGHSLPATVQAATLLYVTVDGTLIRSSEIKKSSIPFLVTDQNLTYELDVKNTGNVHFSAFFSGRLEGLFVKQSGSEVGYLLMPGVPRTIKGSIPMPLLPGIYRATYGFGAENVKGTMTKTTYVLFIPPWSVAALVVTLMLGRLVWQNRHNRKVAVEEE